MRKKRLWICLGIAAAAVLSSPFLDQPISGPVIRFFGDSMDWRSRWLMGSNGIDCGRVKVDGDPQTATICVLKAESEGKPFRVRYDVMGYDAAVAGRVVRTPSGELYALSFDGNPHGAGYTSLLAQRSSKSLCPRPYHLWVNSKGRINCFQQQLSYPKNLSSPNMEPY
jgi:hypothetical protein